VPEAGGVSPAPHEISSFSRSSSLACAFLGFSDENFGAYEKVFMACERECIAADMIDVSAFSFFSIQHLFTSAA